MIGICSVLSNYSLAVLPDGKLVPVAEVVLLGESPRYAIDPNDPTKVTRGAVLISSFLLLVFVAARCVLNLGAYQSRQQQASFCRS